MANDAIRVRMYDQDTEETYGANATAERNKIAEDQATKEWQDRSSAMEREDMSQGVMMRDAQMQKGATLAQTGGPITSRNIANAIGGGPEASRGIEAIQKSQATEMNNSVPSSQTLQNTVNTPADSGEDKSQSSIKPEDTSIGAQEFNRIFGNFYNATAGW